jgi:hypothetical protein
MKIPPFWVRETVNGAIAFGWSFHSRAEASELAKARAREIAARIAAGTIRDAKQGYYTDRPVREPILKEFRDEHGNINALLTRNSYGTLVLNTSRALFIDVDFPPPPKAKPTGLMKVISSLFGSREPEPAAPAPGDPMEAILAKAEAWANAHAPWQWRIYRTKAGVRLLATHGPCDVSAPIVQQAFDALGSDPLYRKLCEVQQCYRARLTPKPWRCDYWAPAERWPFSSVEQELAYRAWEDDYIDCCKEWATCALVSTTSDNVHPELAEIVSFHDAATKATSGLPLA